MSKHMTIYAGHHHFVGHTAVSDCLNWYLKQSRLPIDGRYRYQLEYDRGHMKAYEKHFFTAGSIAEMLQRIIQITGAESVCLMAYDEDGNHQHIESASRPDLFTRAAA